MISVPIVLDDKMTVTAEAVAGALDRISAREKQINDTAQKLGVSYAEASKAVALVEQEHRKLAAAAVAAAREQERAAAKAADEQAKAQKAAAAAIEKQRKQEEKRAKDAEAAEKKRREDLKKGALALSAMAVAAAAAVAAVAGIGVKLATVAAGAGAARDNARALMHGLTDKQGARALELVDGLAKDLGIKIEDAREQFIAFKQAGASNKLSTELIKTRADLIAFGLSSEAAGEAIDKVLSEKDASKQASALKDLRDRYGIVGDGALAAQRNAMSFAGAMNRLDNTKIALQEKLWDRIGPSIDKIGTKIANVAERLLASEKTTKVIDAIGRAFEFVADALDPVLGFLSKHSELIGIVLVGAVAGLAAGVALLALPLIKVTAVATLFIAKVVAIGTAVGTAVALVVKHWDTIKELPSRLYKWGEDVVNGFIGGIKSRISAAVAQIKSFAQSVAGPFASALGIKSPSTLFAEYGANTVQGYEQGQEREMPNAFPLEERAVEAPGIPRPPPGAASVSAAPGGAAPSSGGGITIESLIVQAASSESAEIAAAIRRELEILLKVASLKGDNDASVLG